MTPVRFISVHHSDHVFHFQLLFLVTTASKAVSFGDKLCFVRCCDTPARVLTLSYVTTCLP
jgi:hypothetical protein